MNGQSPAADTPLPSKIKIVDCGGRTYAIKVFNKKYIDGKCIQKEVAIHKMLDHRFIVKYITCYEDIASASLMMEFAEYNLRNLIIPEVGLDPLIAHMMFVQLVDGIAYLHSQGICHRDIKPDNILVNHRGNVKISDFGHSTFYKLKEYRRLKSVSGTVEFMAPEVHKASYDGPAADVFSMGITLLNMLTGKLPWEEATNRDNKYRAYRMMQYHYYDPFNRLRDTTARLVDCMLAEESKRIAIDGVMSDQWFVQTNSLMRPDGECVDCRFLQSAERKMADLHYTQPEAINGRVCFVNTSQPVQPPTIHRFYLAGGVDEAIKSVQQVLENMTVLSQKNLNTVLFSTTDTKKNKLTGEIVIQGLDGNSMVTIRRTRGDLLEFKKFLVCLNNQFFV